MAYLSADGYDYDIFVSYAHVDDQPMPGAAQGWVTTFANCIKTKLAQKLGRNDAYALWMDYELRGGQPITPHILDKLQRSATLFVVLSPGYSEVGLVPAGTRHLRRHGRKRSGAVGLRRRAGAPR